MVSVGGGAGSDVAAALALRSFLQERRGGAAAALTRINSCCARPHKQLLRSPAHTQVEARGGGR